MIQKFLGTIVKTRVVENLGAKARKYENISKLWSLNTCQFPKQQFKISNSLRLSLDSYFYCQHRNASNRIVFLQKDGAWKIKDLTILIKDRDFLLFSCFCQKGIRCVLSNCLIAPQFQKKKNIELHVKLHSGVLRTSLNTKFSPRGLHVIFWHNKSLIRLLIYVWKH